MIENSEEVTYAIRQEGISECQEQIKITFIKKVRRPKLQIYPCACHN
jgi:hypothetical protein